MSGGGPQRTWSRFKYPQSLIRFGIYLLIVVFIGYSVDYLNVHLGRFTTMFGRLLDLFSHRYYPPEISYVLEKDYLEYVLETVKMAYLGALFGIVLSIPISWFASFNMTPSRRFLYPLGRFAIMLSRSVHEMIWAILFVTILGFGMLPGVMALTLFSLGFAGKLFSEEIEAINRGQVEAIRATGANRIQEFIYAVLPQVRVAWTGISIYTWDAAFRAATVVGFFGAGGMGWYLRRTVQQVQTTRVAAILMSIIALVVVSEVVSAWARSKVRRV
ncbi:MAG: phosphonate ABC transporter, permease protein PhnE [Deltaproteobacteria bacterium]|nr:phosphonate ABC transporter, permease protein PhnE [Deltaproteobacteria bacterium]